MRKSAPKTSPARPTKEVSVMAWIEDPNQNILLVRQSAGLKFWTLPGGKVKRGEALIKALKREVYEETGLHVQIGSLLGVLDRRDKDAITLLFAAVVTSGSLKVKRKQREIKEVSFQASLPEKASPSAKYFWSARRTSLREGLKVRVSTEPAFDVPLT
jgi:8-oxo-dGTP diphosphatase